MRGRTISGFVPPGIPGGRPAGAPTRCAFLADLSPYVRVFAVHVPPPRIVGDVGSGVQGFIVTEDMFIIAALPHRPTGSGSKGVDASAENVFSARTISESGCRFARGEGWLIGFFSGIGFLVKEGSGVRAGLKPAPTIRTGNEFLEFRLRTGEMDDASKDRLP